MIIENYIQIKDLDLEYGQVIKDDVFYGYKVDGINKKGLSCII